VVVEAGRYVTLGSYSTVPIMLRSQHKCVMHKCVVHFVPVNKQLPDCRKHPSSKFMMPYSKSSRPTRTITSISDHPNVLTILWMQRGERKID
jgi:hypothetical protein